MTLEDVLAQIENFSAKAWLYLAEEHGWKTSSIATVLESEEVSPEEEDHPDAGIPLIAKTNGMKQILPVTVVQDVMANLKFSRPNATADDWVEAARFYYENDAFISA